MFLHIQIHTHMHARAIIYIYIYIYIYVYTYTFSVLYTHKHKQTYIYIYIYSTENIKYQIRYNFKSLSWPVSVFVPVVLFIYVTLYFKKFYSARIKFWVVLTLKFNISVINRCKKLTHVMKLAKEQLQPQPEGTYEAHVNSENVAASRLISEAI